MKKLIFLGWALIALLASGCSEDNENKELDLPNFELIELGDHHLFPNTPSCSYGNFGLAFYNGNEFCTFVSNDIEEEYTAEEIFELADEIHQAIPMCTCGISTTLSIPRLDTKHQKIWVAVRNEKHCMEKNVFLDSSESIIYPYPPIEPPIEESEM